MIFEKDIVAWGLAEDGKRVMEVHLLKDRRVLTGPWIERWRWERAQRGMKKPYPERLRVPVDVLVMEAGVQERLGI